MMLMSLSSFAASEGWPANYDGVMLQAFWWDSYDATKWSALTNRADELSKYFDLIWIPNAGTTASHAKGNEMGYMPCYYLDYNTCFGTEQELYTLIDTYKAKGTGIIEDVVINHKNGFMSWCNFPAETATGRKSGKKYSMSWDNTNYTGICCTDEANREAGSGVAGKIKGANDTGDDFNGCRDLDHTNSLVQQNIKTYCDYMLNEVGFAGFRYDMVKGYSGYYTKIYNDACNVKFSVGEYWDSSEAIRNWINSTEKRSAAFDFGLKYTIADAFNNGNYSKLAYFCNAGDDNYKRYTITFVDNHDTGRTDGAGSNPLGRDWSAANAYILAIPGTPCVWLKHYNADAKNIGAMILARKAAGITNQSASQWNGNSVTTTGKNGKVYACFGSSAASANPGAGYTLVAKGDNYCFWSTASSSLAEVQFSQSGSTFKTETLSITLTPKNATSAWYQIGDGARTSISAATQVTIGSGVAVGSKIVIKWGATGSDGKEQTGTETYTKKDASAQLKIFFDNSSYNWNTVYAYVYSASGEVAKWPGTQMALDANTGYYTMDIADEFENSNVIFTESKDATSHRYPGDGETGMAISGSSMIFKANNKWEEYSDGPVPPVPTAPVITLTPSSSFKTNSYSVTINVQNATSATYSIDGGAEKPVPEAAGIFTTAITVGESLAYDQHTTVTVNATNESGTVTKSATYTKKDPNTPVGDLASYYKTNPNGSGQKKSITVDGDLSDWTSADIIAQGAANDDPRVYRDNSMYEVPIDLYALYGAYDDQNIYLAWEMTNVQDIVAPMDDYPLSQGVLYSTMNVPFFIALNTGKNTIGNYCKTATGGTLWGSGITFEQPVSNIIAISTNGANGPYIYGGDVSGLNAKEVYGVKDSGISFKYGPGISSSKIWGIDGGYGVNNNRTVGDMKSDNAKWVDFVSKGHNSSKLDFHYEMSIPLAKLGITAADVASKGLGVMLVATMGKSGMDCLPYDLAMNDNADQPDTESQEFNSYEKSDEDNITAKFASIGKSGSPDPVVKPTVTISPATGTSFDGSLEVTITVANAETASYTINDGTTISLANGANKFTINATSTVKATAANANGNASATATYTATLKVGDINGDNKIDVADYNALVDIIIRKSAAPAKGSEAFSKADVNGDGIVNSTDIMAIENIINNK